MPRILIDISRLFYRRLLGWLPTGIDRIGLEYLRHYDDGACVVLTLGPFSSVLSQADSAHAARMLLTPGAFTIMQALRLALKAYVRWWVRPNVAGHILFNTSHTGLNGRRYASGLRRRGAKLVFFVHDLIPLTHPEYCRPGERERHIARMHTAVSIGSGIIANSQDTLDALVQFARDTALPLPPAVVAPLAPSLPPTDPGPRLIATSYFVVVGTIEPRKNHILLLHLWRRLIEKLGDAAPRLVVIGQRGWECENVVDLLERCQELRGYVYEHNTCSDQLLVNYLRHARALLFPSFVEGYGIPVAEALSIGTPVIASDLQVLREFAGDVPDYADPLDGKHWMNLILDYSSEQSDRRAAQLNRLSRFHVTSWEDHFKTVNTFIQQR